MFTKIRRLLIGVDELLDTRGGTLILIDPKRAAELFHDVKYSCRLVDQFEGIEDQEFKTKYENRDSTTLKASVLCHSYRLVQDFVHRVMNRNFNSPVKIECEIHINMWPYKLSEKEQDLIVKGLQSKFPYEVTIKAVNYSLEELKPDLIRENYDTVFLYEFFRWVEFHVKEDFGLGTTNFFAPALVKKFDKEFPKDVRKFFTDLMLYFKFHGIDVVFMPVDTFSSVLAKTINFSTQEGGEASNLDDVPMPSEGFDSQWT